MVETFTPAGCGGRIRRWAAVLLFTVAAAATAGALGAGLGTAGGWLPGRWTLGAAALLGAAGVARELGLVRFPIPAVRRQVPEPWRRRAPLAAWSTGYGAILGSGIATFQPVITFWVACAGAVALGDTVAGAVCLGCFGIGRAAMVAAPGGDPLRRLAALHRHVRPANAVTLAAFVALLVPAIGAGGPPSGQSDPAVSGGVLADTQYVNGATAVVVQPPGAPAVVFDGARMPALSGDALAYADAQGVRLILWRTGQEVFRLTGAYDKPALSGEWFAYVQAIRGGHRLILRNLPSGAVTVLARTGPGVDLGRPSISGQLVAWHQQAGTGSVIRLRNLATRRTSTVVRGARRRLLANPTLGSGHIAWVDGLAESSRLMVQNITTGRTRRIGNTAGPRFQFGNTAMDGGVVLVTRWDLGTGEARILRYRR